MSPPRLPSVVLYLGGTGLEIARSLGRRGVHVIGMDVTADQPAAWSRFCTARPCPDPIAAPELLLATLCELGRELGRAVLFPASDAYGLFLHRHRERLTEWFHLPLPPGTLVPTLMDKRALHSIARKQNICVPRTCIPESSADVEDFARTAAFPCLLKPALSHAWRGPSIARLVGSRKVFLAANRDELMEAYAFLAEISPELVAQEVVPVASGESYYVSCYFPTGGREPTALTHRKLRTWPTAFGTGTLLESTHEPEVTSRALTFLHQIGYEGLAGVDLVRDSRDGELLLIEVNVRYGVGDSLGAFCGADLAFICYADLCGIRVPPVCVPRAGVRWIAMEGDLYSSVSQVLQGRLGLRQWWRSVARAEHHWDLFARDDPWPAAKSLPRLLWAGFALGVKQLARVMRGDSGEYRSP